MSGKKNLSRAHTPTPADTLLADVAIRVQLSPTDYNKAVNRYQSINDWIDRDGSLLEGHVTLFYAQGSMAIGTTIASRLKTDEFDIDIVAQLDLPDNTSPKEVLDRLYKAIRGEPGSRYYQMTERRTRCVTVHYSDNMHLDVTPALRMISTPERQSLIFHHQQEQPQQPGCRLIANPYGFAEWFKTATLPLPDDHFADFFEKRAKQYESTLMLAKADSDSVPQQEPVFRKSKAVIVLQLLKRWRNIQYDTRQGRQPPSIMIAALVADVANTTDSLSSELLYQAKCMLDVFRKHHDQGKLVHIVNPVCVEDVLTDRWPRSLKEQDQFISDLEVLKRKAEKLVEGCDLAEMGAIMESLFGESPAKEALEAFTKQTGNEIGKGRSRCDPQTGSLITAGVGAAMATHGTAPSRTLATPRHTFYGTEQRKR